jgi:hypothetical protein
MKTYIPIPADRPVKTAGEQATHFKVTVDYDKGGINYFSYKTDPRGYYVYVSPVVRKQDDNGFKWESTALTGDGSGFKLFLKPATRLNRKTLAAIETAVQDTLAAMTEPLLQADRPALLALFDTLKA